MKANELMIGDWVYSTFCDKPCKVIGIEQYESEYVNVKVTNVTGAKDINSLTPIPLTPGILEKNGHKVPGYAVWDLEAAGAEVQWVRETMDTINPLMQYRLAPRQKHFGVQETLICHIKYVHQLQHALRLCEIEKEIIL